MRINKFVAGASGMSRRTADEMIRQGRVTINGQVAELGDDVNTDAIIRFDDKLLRSPKEYVTIMLNKPAGYVCSRNGQGSRTIYDLLPSEYSALKPVGRLDKDSSGLLLLTSDGSLAERLTHPRYAKEKIYTVTLSAPLQQHHGLQIEQGVPLEDGPSRLRLERLDADGYEWRVTMTEGRNRQIRRTFAALGYRVIWLHRTQFGPFELDSLPESKFQTVQV